MEALIAAWPRLTVMAGLLLFSAIFAGSETAFFSLVREDVRRLREDGTFLSALVVRLRSNARTLLVSVLLGNLAVNIGYFSLAAGLSGRVAARGSTGAAVAVGALSVLFLILTGEFLPKGFALHRPVWTARISAIPLFFFSQAILPLRVVLDRLVAGVTRIFGAGRLSGDHVTAEELKAFVRLSGASGGLREQESEMLEDVIDLVEIRVREVMVPRVDLVALDLKEGREGVLALAREKRVSKILVYEGSVDEVKGFVAVKDLLYEPGRAVSELVREIRAVPETMRAEALLKEFRATGEPMALVVDEYGGTEGIVTPEDVLEEVVGEIVDEYDAEKGQIRRIAPGCRLVSGDLSVRDWEDWAGEPLPEGKYETVGGFLLAEIDRLPVPGDVVRAPGFRLTVLRVRGGRILSLLADRDRPGEGA